MTSGVPLLAASFASKFDTIGPYVGFASLIAVVAMAILVFSQGRELQRLREWAGTSPERLEALEDEIRARAYGGAPPQAQGAGPARPGTLARHPGAVAGAAGVAAPGAPPGAPVTAAATATPPPPGSPVTGASTTADGAAVPPGGARPVPPRPTPPGGPGATRILPAASTAGGPRAATPAGMAAATAREREAADGGSRRSLGQILGVGAVVLVVLVALLFAFGVIGGDGGNPAVDEKNRADPIANPEKPRKTTRTYSLTSTRVTVLNGSGQSGVAKSVSDEIDQKLRFPLGKPSNYLVNGVPPTPSLATTLVLYATGEGQSRNRDAARDIAKGLGLKTNGTVVRAANADAKANAPDAKVVVVVGQDLAAKYADEPSSSNANGGATGDTSGGTTGGTGGTSGTTTPGTTGGTGGATTPSAPVDPGAGTAAPDATATPDGTADPTGTAGGGTAP
ncbi:LytR C-terminal domain-containing protein [Patulibacter americanus]|uniref:LytR C-terminal domain-containing protein n=1 Tax=Patulibacter americanus TaxID=588672 RepID=UPI0003B6DF0D|nr:LytR C-terminal domain-containing protein [Patulibacter americanus]